MEFVTYEKAKDKLIYNSYIMYIFEKFGTEEKSIF